MSTPAPSQQQTIVVTMNLTNYPPNKPSMNCAPQKARMNVGTDTITWNLNPQNVPTGYSVTFDSPNRTGGLDGIVFTQTKGNIPFTVSRNSDTQYVATEASAVTVKTDYSYTVNIIVTDPQGNVTLFSYEPDVENVPVGP